MQCIGTIYFRLGILTLRYGQQEHRQLGTDQVPSVTQYLTFLGRITPVDLPA